MGAGMDFRDDQARTNGTEMSAGDSPYQDLLSRSSIHLPKVADGLGETQAVPMTNSGQIRDLVRDDTVVADALAQAGAVLAKATADAAKGAKEDSKAIMARRFAIVTDAARDVLLPDFGKDTLHDRYRLPKET